MNHFNFKQVSELFLKNQSAMNAFENENSPNKVVIMFGRTGLGKSTAI
jgi:putative ribosome biogenesis GTPase RsgA